MWICRWPDFVHPISSRPTKCYQFAWPIIQRFGLKINELKTETMILNNMEPEYTKSIITLRNTLINNVENFKYLGAFIKHDQPSTGDVELNYRIQITVSKFVEMSALLQNVKINLRTRVSFFNSFIRSRSSIFLSKLEFNSSSIWKNSFNLSKPLEANDQRRLQPCWRKW